MLLKWTSLTTFPDDPENIEILEKDIKFVFALDNSDSDLIVWKKKKEL